MAVAQAAMSVWRDRFYLTLTLVVAMLTMAVAPVCLVACDDLDAAAATHATTPRAACNATGHTGDCSSGPQGSHPVFMACGLSPARSCHCNCLLAPLSVPPAVVEAVTWDLPSDSLAVLPRPVSLETPVQWYWQRPHASTGLPQTSYDPSAAPRGPPARWTSG
jgi:hypothetical protein